MSNSAPTRDDRGAFARTLLSELVEAIADLDPFDSAAGAFIQSALEPVNTAAAVEYERVRESGQRRCGAEAVRRPHVIEVAKRAGFTLRHATVRRLTARSLIPAPAPAFALRAR